MRCCKHPSECGAPGFCDRDLAASLPAADFAKYVAARVEMQLSVETTRMEAQMQTRIAAELERLRAMDARERAVLQARRHIEEEILLLRCPRPGCRRAFLDFDGCFALSCSSCPCKFCGWCLRDCGDGDAHAHVRACARVPRGTNPLFPRPDPLGVFGRVHRERRRDEVRAHLDRLPLEEREGVLQALAHHFRELGV